MGDEEVNFVFPEWAENSGLSKKTVTTSRKEECTTHATLKHLTSRDINRMNIVVGQARLLRVALVALGNPIAVGDEPAPPKPGTSQEGEGDGGDNAKAAEQLLAEAGDELDQVLQGGGDHEEPTDSPHPTLGALGIHRGGHGSSSGYCDPLMLLTVKSTAKKAHQILNYLPEPIKARINRRKMEQFSLATTADGAITLKTEEQGTYYISVDEWSGANMRLGAELLRLGEIKQEELVYYMAYTAMISDLAARYKWMSVLEFDTRYRELQAAHGFPWGTDHPHTERHILVPRRLSQVVKGKIGTYNRRGRQEDGEQEKPLCRDYIKGRCQFGPKCRYKHEKPTSVEAPRDPPKNE